MDTPTGTTAAAAPTGAASAADRCLDIRGEVCPYTFVKSLLALEDLQVGEVLEVLLGNPDSAANVPRSFAARGQEVVGCTQTGAREWRLRVRKVREA